MRSNLLRRLERLERECYRGMDARALIFAYWLGGLEPDDSDEAAETALARALHYRDWQDFQQAVERMKATGADAGLLANMEKARGELVALQRRISNASSRA